MHIFWQRRIDADDETTPYWYPFQTNSGAIRQDRLVFPIPRGVHWKDVRAVVAPTVGEAVNSSPGVAQPKQLQSPKSRTPKAPPVATHPNVAPPGKVGIFVGGKIKYTDRPGYVPEKPATKPRPAKAEKPPAPKFDPKFLAAARELRDRWLEQVNTGSYVLEAHGKYDVSR